MQANQNDAAGSPSQTSPSPRALHPAQPRPRTVPPASVSRRKTREPNWDPHPWLSMQEVLSVAIWGPGTMDT